MLPSSRNPERIDELRDCPQPSAADLELTICRQAMQIQALEQQVRELSETRLARQVACVIDRLGLRYAHNPYYAHSAFTASDRRDLAEVLNVDNYAAAERQEGSE